MFVDVSALDDANNALPRNIEMCWPSVTASYPKRNIILTYVAAEASKLTKFVYLVYMEFKLKKFKGSPISFNHGSLGHYWKCHTSL